MRGGRTNVGNLEDEVGHEFLLDSQAPLLYTRGLQMRLDNEHRWLNLHLPSVLETLIHNRILSFTDELCGAWGIAGKVKPGVGVHRRIKNSGPATDYCFAVAERRCP